MKFVDIHSGETSNKRIVEIRCIRCHEITLIELEPNDFDDYTFALTVCARCITINYNLDKVTIN